MRTGTEARNAGTSPSNRLSHGLSSRARKEERSGEAFDLAQDLIGNGPATEEMLDVAVALADAILLLVAIRAERQATLSRLPPSLEIDPIEMIMIDNGFFEGAPPRAWFPKVMRALARAEAIPEGKSDLVETARILLKRKSELVTLDDYERKASSRRKKLLTRLDYLRIEAMRSRA